MNRKSKCCAAAGALGMGMLILDSRTGLAGAAEGWQLCLASVIPSLFPFFVLTDLLLASCPGILAPAVLGGYPTGARAVGSGYRSGIYTRAQAERLLMCCANPGPSFIFGIVGSRFSHPAAPWVIWGVQLLSAFLVSRRIPRVSADRPAQHSITLSEAVENAVKSMALVCGWVMLFRMMMAFLDRWFLCILPQTLRVIVCAVLELTNGCCMLDTIASEELRFLICCAVLSLGGVCVAMQTASVIRPLSLKPYLLGKLIQCACSILLAIALLPSIPAGIRLCAGILAFFPGMGRKEKNNSSIPGPVIV